MPVRPAGKTAIACLLVLSCLSACTPRRRAYRDQWQAGTNVAVQREVDRSVRPPRPRYYDEDTRREDRQSNVRPLPVKQASTNCCRPAKRRRKRRKSALSSTEQKRLLTALECTHDNHDDAAQLLGMSRMTLERRLSQQGLVRKDGKDLSP